MRRRSIAAGAVVVAIVVWRSATRSATPAHAGNGSAEASATAKRKADPRKEAHATVTGTITAAAGKLTAGTDTHTAAGKPVAHAHVCADATSNEIARDAICVDSDAAGAYTLADLYATDYRVTVNARGYKPVASKLHLEAGAHANADLSLPAGGVEVAGTVSDIAGGPIAHAQLRSGDALVESDDAGAFSLWVDAGSTSLDAAADGYAPATWNGTAPDRIELRLSPESSLSGTVVMQSGEPLADAQVEINAIDWRNPTVDVTSGEDGSFHADRLAPGRYALTVRSPHAYGTSEGSVLVSLAEHTDGLVITAVPAFEITGKVTGDDGTGCDGYLRLVDEDHARQLDAYSDATGALELGGVLPGTYEVTASCTGWVSRDAGALEIKDKDVSGTWAVEAGASVHGKVTMRDGSPAAGVDVRFQGPSWATANTAADGTYKVAGLSPGQYAVVTQSQRGIDTERATIDVTEKAIIEHDLVLDPAATIKGVVVDARGAPVPGAYVRLRDVYGGASTATDGTFTIVPALPGDHELAVEFADSYLQRPGAEPDDANQAIAKVSCEAGQTATVRIVVDVASAELRGTVVEPNGAPAHDVIVEISTSTSDTNVQQLTGDDGAFRFPATKGAHYRVHAYAPGRGEVFADAQPGDALHLQLASTQIAGIVRGNPEELTITLSGTMYRTETFFRTGGKFALHDLRPGHYSVVFDSPSGHFESQVEVGDVASDPLDITLDPVFTLTGRVVKGDSHAAIAGAKIQLRIGSQTLPDDGEGAVTDGAGRFTIKRAHAGTANVRVMMDGMQTMWLEATVTGPMLDDDLVIEDPPPPVYEEEGFSEGE